MVSKLRRQVIWALKKKIRHIPGQTESVHDPYKDSLDDVLDSNINDSVTSTINTNPCLLKQIMSATQPEMPINVPLLLRLFSEITSGRDKSFNFFAERSLSSILLSNNISKEQLNLLLRPSSNYGKLKKKKTQVDTYILRSKRLGFYYKPIWISRRFC